MTPAPGGGAFRSPSVWTALSNVARVGIWIVLPISLLGAFFSWVSALGTSGNLRGLGVLYDVTGAMNLLTLVVALVTGGVGISLDRRGRERQAAALRLAVIAVALVVLVVGVILVSLAFNAPDCGYLGPPC